MKSRYCIALAVSSALGAPLAQAAFSVTGVTMNNLGTLGGPYSAALDINDAGNIVGESDNSLGEQRGFYLSGGVMTEIGGATGTMTSTANGINNSNQVVGTVYDVGGYYGFRWNGGIAAPFTDCAPIYPFVTDVHTAGQAVADNGRVVGQCDFPNWIFDFTSARLWTSPAVDIPLAPTWDGDMSTALVEDVDELGRAVGTNLYGPNGWLWHPLGPSGSAEKLVPGTAPIGAYTWEYSNPYGVHEKTGVVGSATYFDPADNKITRAFIWNTAAVSVTSIGVLPLGTRSAAEDLNGERFVVGTSNTASAIGLKLTNSAFIWHRDFGMYALPKGTYTHCYAYALNERARDGYIRVVGACTKGADTRAVRWNVRVAGP